jgi:hypothetical protein
MKKLRVYIDTSVIGGCFDPEFAGPSRVVFHSAQQGSFDLVVSDVATAELAGAPPTVQSFYHSLPQGLLEMVSVSEEAVRLHRAYLSYGVVGSASRDDALHVAVATVSHCDLIVSWNFKHIVHFDKIRAYNAVNALEGYSPIAIHSPPEVI